MMKYKRMKIKYLLIIAIAAITVISCKQQTQIDYAIISGEISNKVDDKIALYAYSIVDFDETLNVSEDGKFIDTLFRVKPRIYLLSDGKNMIKVYIDVGTNIDIRYDATDFLNTISFSGEGSEIGRYLFAKDKKEKELVGDSWSVYKLEEADFKAKIRETKTALEELISSTEGISEEYKANEKRNINYSYLSKIDSYQRFHANYVKNPDFKVSEGFLNELGDLTYDNEEDFLFSLAYQLLARTYYTKQADDLAQSTLIEKDIAFLKVVGAINNETVKNLLLYSKAKLGITYTQNIEEFYNAFIAASSDEEHIKEITESYNELKTVAKGQASPKFEAYENYAGGTTSLDDLKGKYVYIDVWATWCGPCIKEVPFLKEVEKQYHGKNIEFVSISLDVAKNYDKWKKMVKDKELGGIQLLADKDWKSEFVREYLIKGIPRFILIDPNGFIVTSNAPRPSDDKLIELFNELNI